MPKDAALTRIRPNHDTSEPAPEFILRVHNAAINHLSFSEDGRFLISSDADGFVAVWSLFSFRPLLFWQAHKASVLCTVPWGDKFVTHGRDDRIHVFAFPEIPALVSSSGTSAGPSHSNLSPVDALYTLEVNSLSFCKCAVYKASQEEALIAVQSVTKDEEVDIFHLPSKHRVSRAIGSGVWPINDKTGTVMGLALHAQGDKLTLLAAFEDGRLAIFASSLPKALDAFRIGEGEGWTLLWYGKGHSEPIMGLAVSPDLQYAWTVAADRYIVRWNVGQATEESKEEETITKYSTQSIGRSTIAVRDDQRIFAVAQWDGVTCIYSVKTGKQLASLQFHRDSVYAAAFSPLRLEDGTIGKAWVATAGKDQRIALWEVYPVEAC